MQIGVIPGQTPAKKVQTSGEGLFVARDLGEAATQPIRISPLADLQSFTWQMHRTGDQRKICGPNSSACFSPRLTHGRLNFIQSSTLQLESVT